MLTFPTYKEVYNSTSLKVDIKDGKRSKVNCKHVHEAIKKKSKNEPQPVFSMGKSAILTGFVKYPNSRRWRHRQNIFLLFSNLVKGIKKVQTTCVKIQLNHLTHVQGY